MADAAPAEKPALAVDTSGVDVKLEAEETKEGEPVFDDAVVAAAEALPEPEGPDDDSGFAPPTITNKRIQEIVASTPKRGNVDYKSSPRHAKADSS